MSISDLDDQDVVIMYDVLAEMRVCYDKMMNCLTVTSELTKEDMQEAYEGLARFGKRMMEFEEGLQKVFVVKKEIDVLVRASQMNAKIQGQSEQTFQNKPRKRDTK